MVEINGYSILKDLLQLTSPFVREGFLENSVRAMSRLLGADFAFVTRVLDEPATKVQVLASWQNGAKKDCWDFDLAGTPCDLIYDSSAGELAGAVVQNSGQIVIAEDVCHKFPATRGTAYQSFIGIPIWSRQAQMIGHVAVFFEKRLRDAEHATQVADMLQLLAHRIEAEFDRMRLEGEMRQTNEELQRANAQLLKDSITDPLTHLMNRRYFNQRCKEALAHFQRFNEGFFLLLIDVDYFKEVNDQFGHEAGDLMLKAIADRLAHNLREGVEVLARIGGEEFAVVCHGVTSIEEAATLAERMRSAIDERAFHINGHDIIVSVSIGVAGANKRDISWEQTYRRADKVMYSAKGKGRNQVCVATIEE